MLNPMTLVLGFEGLFFMDVVLKVKISKIKTKALKLGIFVVLLKHL